MKTNKNTVKFVFPPRDAKCDVCYTHGAWMKDGKTNKFCKCGKFGRDRGINEQTIYWYLVEVVAKLAECC